MKKTIEMPVANGSYLKQMLSATVFGLVMLGMPAWAATYNFSGDFAPSYWTRQIELGSASFQNTNTELHLLGPTGLVVPNTSSADAIAYSGPGSGGLPQAGLLSFHWTFNSGDALSAQADFSWLSGGSPLTQTLKSGGPGTIAEGNLSMSLDQGATFGFLLTTLNPDGKKTPAEFVVSQFAFEPIPEPTVLTSLALAGALWVLGHRKLRR